MLLREVPADHAATDRTNDRVVPRVMPGDSAHDRTLEAACGVCSDLSAQNVLNKPVALWLETVFSAQRLLWRILVEQLVVL
jgi:hypothetical protein